MKKTENKPLEVPGVTVQYTPFEAADAIHRILASFTPAERLMIFNWLQDVQPKPKRELTGRVENGIYVPEDNFPPVQSSSGKEEVKSWPSSGCTPCKKCGPGICMCKAQIKAIRHEKETARVFLQKNSGNEEVSAVHYKAPVTTFTVPTETEPSFKQPKQYKTSPEKRKRELDRYYKNKEQKRPYARKYKKQNPTKTHLTELDDVKSLGDIIEESKRASQDDPKHI